MQPRDNFRISRDRVPHRMQSRSRSAPGLTASTLGSECTGNTRPVHPRPSLGEAHTHKLGPGCMSPPRHRPRR